MKYILALLLSLSFIAFAPDTKAATPIDDDTARQYFQNCTAQQDPRMSAKSQQEMCACNAVMMQQNFSMEEMQLMLSDSIESRIPLNKMLVDVYAPCMNFPVHDLLNNNCRKDNNVQALGGMFNADAFCSCVATNTSTWLAKEGRELMQGILNENPNIFDPIGPVMEHPDFLAEAKRNEKLCTRQR